MMTRLALAAIAVLAACDPPDTLVAPTLDRAEPPYAPLEGGTEVVLRGAGFLAAPNRVFVGGREAPLVRLVDDTRLAVVVPPGDGPGDTELLVFNRNGNTTAHGLLRYSTPPAIADVSPRRVLYTSGTTRITLTGTGFSDEGAGMVDVLVDGSPATDVAVASDTELSFTAPPGRALLRPELTVVDARGAATMQQSFRYVPSEHAGLLLFQPFSSSFAVFVDPIAMEVVPIPWVSSPTVRFTSVIRDDQGDYWGIDRNLQMGRIDMRTQTLENPIPLGVLLPAVARVGDDYLAIDRISLQIVRFDPATGAATPISTPITCCGSYGLAALGDTVYFTARSAGVITINTVDPVTGSLGTPVTLTGPPGLHVEDMRAFGGVLYATSRDGALYTIDPATATATALPIAPGRANAMELFD